MKENKKVLQNLMFFLLLCLVVLCLYIQLEKQHSMRELPKVQSGMLDLREWDFDKEGVVPLNGEWNYYEGRFLSVEEIQNTKAKPIHIPSKLKGKGKETYHLQIRLPAARTIYGLKINNIRMSHAFFINEEFVGGETSLSSQYVANNSAYTSFFYTDNNMINVIVHVENQDFVNRGIVKPIYFGTQQSMISFQNIQFGLNFALVMILIVFSLYYLVIYTVRKNERFFLYSGIYFGILAISVTFGGEKILLHLFPEIPFTIVYKGRDFLGTLTIIPFLLFLNEFEVRIISPKTFRIINVSIVLILILNIALPYSVYVIFQYWMWGYIWFLLFVVIVKLTVLIFKKRIVPAEKDELILIYIAFSSLGIFLGMEILVSIKPMQLFHEAWMVLFVIIMTIFIAKKTTNVMKSLEKTRDEAIRTKISYLNLQIKPHFIYNAISNIISLCYTDSRKAAQLLSKLSTYLRLIFENNRQDATIPFQKELELIKAYVEIEKTRLNNRIDVHFFIEDTISSLLIPSLSIQPFVENAIRHGLFNKLSRGNVTISAKVVKGHLEVIIEDDGVGMSMQRVSHILNDSNRQGVGIQNVHHRLMMIQGATLEIISTENKGTTVHIHLPIKFNEWEKENASNNYY